MMSLIARLPSWQPKTRVHVITTIAPVIAGMAVDQDAVRCWLHRKRTIPPWMTGSGAKNLTASNLSAESGAQGFQINGLVAHCI
jgi:hypothetical protein